MKKHFENIGFLYGNTGVRLPNAIFRDLSLNIKSKNGSTNIQQVTFAYTYLVVVSFLYKYAHFVDLDNKSYIQNSDIKELLGYNRITKSIDKIIKKNGILDELGLTRTMKDYPISFYTSSEEINGIGIREFVTIGELDSEDINYRKYKDIVKNRNYEIKEPLFLTTEYKDSDYGTLYSIERTHQITLHEFLNLIFDEDISNIDFLLYGFFKSKCKGYKDDVASLAVDRIISEIGIDRSTYYNHLNLLKDKGYIEVNHKEWKANEKVESNDYCFKGCI